MFKIFRSCIQFSSSPSPHHLKCVCFNSTSSSTVNPFERTLRILGNDIKSLFSKKNNANTPVIPSHCDVLIIGGGCMGSSVAYWLKERAEEGLSIVVVEKDPSVMFSNNMIEKLKYKQSTTVLSVGGLRQQFSLKENIELSLESAEFMRNIKHHLSIEGQDPPDIQFQPCGYTFLATEKSAHILEENVKLQRSLGAKVDLLSPEKLKQRFPWMNTDNIALATHGLENEGWFDPYSLLFSFRKKAIHLGVDFVSAELTGFKFKANSNILGADGKEMVQVNDAQVKLPDGTMHNIHYGILVIAAGALSGDVLKMASAGFGEDNQVAQLPIEPRKRYVFNIHCPDGPGLLCPMVIDCSGAYFRREGLGGHYLCGISPPDEEEPPTDNLDVDYSFFEHKVWPLIAHRCPAFENAKLKSAWAGFYDFNKFDENAFIGPHPGFINVYLAAGFSGHGIQQSPAVGRAIMELIIDGDYKTVNLERLEFKRYLENEQLYESNIV